MKLNSIHYIIFTKYNSTLTMSNITHAQGSLSKIESSEKAILTNFQNFNQNINL